MLPNDVLVKIFDWYLGEDQDDLEVDAWYPLVHVCRNWRNIIFSSHRRLNLRLLYTAKPGKPAYEMLGIWPDFPIIIQVNANRPWSVPNVLAALKHKDRIRKIHLVDFAGTDLRTIFSEMQGPFSALTDLVLMSSTKELGPIIPESFSGGFAPRLRSLTVDSIPFPGLPKLVLSSARDLVELSLLKIPSRSGYIRVKAMVTALSASTKLETLSIEFGLEPRRDRNCQYLPPATRSVLPSLKSCLFQGICGYLEDFVARIDTPRLEILDVTLCKYDNHPFSLKRKKNPQFYQFLGRTKMFKILNNASIHFWSDKLEVTLSRKPWAFNAKFTLKIMCQDKIFTLGRVCITRFLPLSKIESLGISSHYHKWQTHREADREDIQWPYSLFFFSAVKSLYLSKEIISSVACGLKQVMDPEGRLPPVLRSLQKISTVTVKPLPSGSVKTAIEGFTAMQGLSALDPPTVPFCWVANEPSAGDL